MPSSRDPKEWVASGFISAETWGDRKTQRLQLHCEYCGSKVFKVSLLEEEYVINFKCTNCGAEMQRSE